MKYEGFKGGLHVFKCSGCDIRWGFKRLEHGKDYMWFHMIAECHKKYYQTFYEDKA